MSNRKGKHFFFIFHFSKILYYLFLENFFPRDLQQNDSNNGIKLALDKRVVSFYFLVTVLDSLSSLNNASERI